MAANKASLQITNLYRERIVSFRTRVESLTDRAWAGVTLDDLDGSFDYWRERTVALVTESQRHALRATSGYLTAFLSSETGNRVRPVVIDTEPYVGKSRDGRPLADALISPLIGTKRALKNGKSPDEALKAGRDRAVRNAGFDLDQTARTALLEAIDSDDRFDGWRRAIRGTCGACAGVATNVSHGLRFPVHPGCQCVSEPNVAGVRDRFPRPTGPQIFAAKTPQEQDEALGPEAAQAYRDGLPLADLVEHSEMENEPDLITQRPLDAVR